MSIGIKDALLRHALCRCSAMTGIDETEVLSAVAEGGRVTLNDSWESECNINVAGGTSARAYCGHSVRCRESSRRAASCSFRTPDMFCTPTLWDDK